MAARGTFLEASLKRLRRLFGTVRLVSAFLLGVCSTAQVKGVCPREVYRTWEYSSCLLRFLLSTVARYYYFQGTISRTASAPHSEVATAFNNATRPQITPLHHLPTTAATSPWHITTTHLTSTASVGAAASKFHALGEPAAARSSGPSAGQRSLSSNPPARGSTATTSTRSSPLTSLTISSPSSLPMEVVRVPCLSDNYVWLLHEPTSSRTAVVDPAELQPVVSELEHRGWSLDAILNTHHHSDHVGANLGLKRRFPGCVVVGPRADRDRIPGIDLEVGEGDIWQLGPLEFRVFDTPGHTRGHIAYWAPQAAALFPGDTLFALGCGRLFEGSPQQMWSSLSKLLVLPDDTAVHCAHEYTAANARFAVTVDPENKLLEERKARVDAARARGEATIPSNLGEEKATNPFLRPRDPAIRQLMGFDSEADDWRVFAAIRAAKDRF